jgi:hypothetical protein
MKLGWKIGLGLGAGLLGYELIGALSRHADRSNLFHAAERRAEATQRPLLVVGDPYGGVWTKIFPAYGCGDVCVDLQGCKCPVQIKTDITKGVDLGANAYVVYVACVLEYVEDIEAAWLEILRLAGSVDNIFVVRVQSWTLSSWLVPGAKWVIRKAPPYENIFQADKRVGLFEGHGSVGALNNSRGYLWP